MDLDANIVEGSKKPSSEWALHTEMYKKKPHCRAVVHAHSMYCTVFAVLNQPLKAVHYVIGDAGVATVPCAPYRTFGSKELAEVTSEACGKSDAVLLANHGMLACGKDFGTPVVLSDEEMDHVMEKFKSYGQVKKK